MNHSQIYQKSYLEHLNKVITEHFPHLCSIQENFSLTLQGISHLVMLDRYSQKDKEQKTLQMGDIVLTIIKIIRSFLHEELEKLLISLLINTDFYFELSKLRKNS